MITKTMISSTIVVCVIFLIYLLYNISNCENFKDIEKNNSLVSVMDFTKQAIKGEKGDLGLHMLEKNGRLFLGGNDSGYSGKNENNQTQLYLGGKHNEGSNNGRKGHTTYKLMIDGYDNDGSTVYPIICKDEDKNIDFYVKNRSSSGSKPLIYSGGDLVVNGSIKSGNTNILHHLMPKGAIIAFNSLTRIPYGWSICNGKNGTPDLQGRFILGSSNTKRFNSKGGIEKVKLTSNQMPTHTHTMNFAGDHGHTGRTSSGGSHSHNWSGKRQQSWPDDRNWSAEFGRGDSSNFEYFKKNTNTTGNHIHNITTSNSGNHRHTINSFGGNQTHENMPPYYALIYIMKII